MVEEPPRLGTGLLLEYFDLGSTAERATGPIGHPHARSRREPSRIGGSQSTIVAPVWHNRSVSITVPRGHIRSRSISVAVPGRHVRGGSVSIITVAGFFVRSCSVSAVAATVYVRGGSVSIVVAWYVRGRSVSIVVARYVRGCSISIALTGPYIRRSAIGRRRRGHKDRPGSSTNVDAARRYINGLRLSASNVHH